MNERYTEKKKSSYEHSENHTNKIKNRIGCLIIIIAGLALYIVSGPSFIAYRNKIKCYNAESDAKAIATYLKEYFTDHDLITISSVEQLINQKNISLSGENTATISITDPDGPIIIEVTEGSGRCPVAYQDATTGWDGNYVYKLSTSND